MTTGAIAYDPTGDAVEQFNGLLRELADLIDDVNEQVRQFVDNLNAVLRWIPFWIADGIVAVANAAVDGVSWLIDQNLEMIRRAGAPWTLSGTGARWTNQVGAVTAGIAPRICEDELETLWRWSGPAQRAYSASVARQKTAVGDIKDLTDMLDTALVEYCWGIVALWVAIVAAFVALATAVAVAVVAAASVVGAPASPPLIVAGVAAAAALIVAAVTAFQAFATMVNGKLTTFRQTLAGYDQFGTGSWPASTTRNFDDSSDDWGIDG